VNTQVETTSGKKAAKCKHQNSNCSNSVWFGLLVFIVTFSHFYRDTQT